MLKQLGVLGPKGTHSEAAASYLNERLGMPYTLLTIPDIFECLQDVEEGRLDTALVPVENSLEGSINITLDTLARSDTLAVVRELIWPVHNQLMAKEGHGTIQRIYSHPQPISQCRTYLQEHYPHAEIVKVASTARAAQLVAEEPASSGFAAICTNRAGTLNGLSPIAEEIQDNMANSTRFFQVARKGSFVQAEPKEKILLICQIEGKKPGALYEILREFAHRGINMTRIESRPARTQLGDYIFFFDIDYTEDTQALEETLSAVERKTIWLKNLGTFPVLTVD